MASKLSEAQDAFFQAFAAMGRTDRIRFSNVAFSSANVLSQDREAVELAGHELLALSAAIDADTSE